MVGYLFITKELTIQILIKIIFIFCFLCLLQNQEILEKGKITERVTERAWERTGDSMKQKK